MRLLQQLTLLVTVVLLFGAQQSSALSGYTYATDTLPMCDIHVEIDDQTQTAAVYIHNYMDGNNYFAGGSYFDFPGRSAAVYSISAALILNVWVSLLPMSSVFRRMAQMGRLHPTPTLGLRSS